MASVRNELGVGCLMVAAAAVVGFLALQMGALGNLGQSTLSVDLPLADAAGLKVDAPISIAGVQVGHVASLRVAGGQALAELAIDSEAPVFRDATFRVRAASLLGEKYLELHPGTADAGRLQAGDALPAAPPQVEIDELVAALGPVLAAVDPEDLGRAVTALANALEDDPDRLKRLLANADVALANAAEASATLPGAVADLRGTLAKARDTLTGVDVRVAQAGPVLTRVDGVIADIESADPGALVAEVRSAVGESRQVIATLDTSGERLSVILDTVSEIDRAELDRMLREEGVLIRLFPKKQKKSKER